MVFLYNSAVHNNQHTPAHTQHINNPLYASVAKEMIPIYERLQSISSGITSIMVS